MYKLSISLFLNFFGIIFTQATVYYQAIETEEAVESLVEIQHSQALPLVLIMEKDSIELKHPQYLSKAFIDKGRIIHKTQFGGGKGPSRQFHFCPKENSTEKCLIHKEFQSLEPLQCTREAIPILEENQTRKCGFKGVGTFYTLYYEICSNQEPYDFGTKELQEIIFEFCYDARNKKLLFIVHSISHPKLLSSKELYRERNIQYSMENMDEFTILNQYNFEATIEEKMNEPNTGSSKHQNKKQKTGKYAYKARKLAPSEDMAFALWRKYTFRYFNTELQHAKLIDLWDEINSYIRRHMEYIFFTKRAKNFTLTGVFDLNSKPREDGQISNMWVKLMYFTTYDENQKKTLSATVILMNNFIDTATDYGALSDSQEKTIDYYCDQQNSCAESLKNKFKDVGGQVRCCSLTKRMSEFFGEDHRVEVPEVILIPGIHEIKE